MLVSVSEHVFPRTAQPGSICHHYSGPARQARRLRAARGPGPLRAPAPAPPARPPGRSSGSGRRARPGPRGAPAGPRRSLRRSVPDPSLREARALGTRTRRILARRAHVLPTGRAVPEIAGPPCRKKQTVKPSGSLTAEEHRNLKRAGVSDKRIPKDFVKHFKN